MIGGIAADRCGGGGKVRARDLGIVIGRGRPGPANAITDVGGRPRRPRDAHRGRRPLVVGQGPVRTGVTVVVPHDGDVFTEPVFAGSHRLNGNGEMTGLEWVREAGLLTGPIGITNTHSVGIVRDALIRHAVRRSPIRDVVLGLPVAGETWDGLLNDIDGFHVTTGARRRSARAAARDGPVAEGNVGGGTGMVCHEFKGGIGTASRVVDDGVGGWTVGVLVQANYGRRDRLRVDGVPVGEEIPVTEVPEPGRAGRRLVAGQRRPRARARSSSSSRPTPRCCRISANGSPSGPASGSPGWAGPARHSSGDLFLCFATGNRALPPTRSRPIRRRSTSTSGVNDRVIGGAVRRRRSRRPRRRSSTRSSRPRR